MVVEAERATPKAHPPTRPGPGARRRGPVAATLRFVAAVMVTSGALLLADAAVTLLWQEPISALIAGRAQAALADELGTLPDAGPERLSDAALRRLAAEHEDSVGTGEAWGRIALPTLDRKYVVVEGTDAGSLRKGPGHYPGTEVPGQRGTVAIAGHRTTYLAPFRTVDRLRRGDELVLEMPYARFTYEVVDQRIVSPTRTEVTRDTGGARLVLSACHPLYSAAKRIVVFAELDRVEPV